MTGDDPSDDGSALPPGYERHEISIPGDPAGRVLDAVTSGPSGGRALLFHSGTPSGPGAHELLADAASAVGWRYVNYVRPGYGRSTPSPGRSVADAAPDALAVLDALGHDEFVTVGWSGGGPHALACAALAPGRCRGAAVVAGVAPHDADGLDWTAGMGAENLVEFELALAGGEPFDDFLQIASSVIAQLEQSELPDGFGDLVSERDKDALAGPLGRYMATSMAGAFEAGIEGWRADDVAFLSDWGFSLAAVGAPVWLHQGDEDRMVPPGHGRWLAGHVPGARYEEWPGEGHISIWEKILPGLVGQLSATSG